MKVDTKVRVKYTADKNLDGRTAVVKGFYMSEEYPIIVFDGTMPNGYNPAIVLSVHCLEKIVDDKN